MKYRELKRDEAPTPKSGRLGVKPPRVGGWEERELLKMWGVGLIRNKKAAEHRALQPSA